MKVRRRRVFFDLTFLTLGSARLRGSRNLIYRVGAGNHDGKGRANETRSTHSGPLNVKTGMTTLEHGGLEILQECY